MSSDDLSSSSFDFQTDSEEERIDLELERKNLHKDLEFAGIDDFEESSSKPENVQREQEINEQLMRPTKYTS